MLVCVYFIVYVQPSHVEHAISILCRRMSSFLMLLLLCVHTVNPFVLQRKMLSTLIILTFTCDTLRIVLKLHAVLARQLDFCMAFNDQLLSVVTQ